MSENRFRCLTCHIEYSSCYTREAGKLCCVPSKMIPINEATYNPDEARALKEDSKLERIIK